MNKLKRVSSMALIGTMAVSSMMPVFAEEKSVPAHINVPATAIDYSVTEKIEMQGTENSTDLTIDSLDVTNNLKAGVLNIDSVEATGDNGWAVVGDDSDFVKMGKNAHKFSMVADGTFDMSTGAYTEAGQVNPGEKDTTAFTGKTGITTEAITDEKAANVVVTISLAKGAGEEIQYEDFELNRYNLNMIGYERGGREPNCSIVDIETQEEVTEVVIPETFEYDGKHYKVTSIGYATFRYCVNLTSINIPDSVTSIDEGAFHLCKSLTSVNIPEGVTSIGKEVFANCESLTSINIPKGVTSIGDSAFSMCKNLTSITIPEGVMSIGSSAFHNCTNLVNINIPEGVTSIGGSTFYNCHNLTSIVIPDSVTSIGRYTFRGCDNLANINVSESVTSIGEGAFYYCESLTSINIPDSVETIGSSAFYGCNKLAIIYSNNSIVDEYEWGAYYTPQKPEIKPYSECPYL